MSEILSAKGKIWQLPPALEPSAEFLAVVDNSPALAKIMLRRGINSPAQALAFLSTEHYTPTNPFELPDVDKALERINQALANNEHITIYGDYDVDGVTGTSLLLTALRMLDAKVGYYIPNRASEGYGLNLKAVSILASKQRTKLLITCDCGVSNFAEINFAKSLGVDVLVLDHHALPDLLPPAKAIVHPKLLSEEHPLFHLPGVGVAYKVAEALLAHHNMAEKTVTLLDYVTLGMIADLVPLIRENRYLVQLGLPKLVQSPRPGIKALLAQIGPSTDTDIVGFGLAPRINAVGRLSDANVAVELLTTDDDKIAHQLSAQLQSDNTKRQEICEQVLSEAEQVIAAKGDISQQKAIAIYKEGWHHGVVGIVASRLVEKYNRPVFIAELDPQEGIVKGSARGIDSLNLCDALKANAHLLNKWGGHKMAAGFSLAADKAEAFCASLVATCNHLLSNTVSAPTLYVDTIIEDTNIDLFALAKSLFRLAPFGMENKKPLFYMSKIHCTNVAPLGRQNKHHRLELEDKQSQKTFSCVFWNTHNIVPTIGDTIDVIFTPEVNVFNGRERLQLVLSDWRLSGKTAQVNVVIATAPIETAPSIDVSPLVPTSISTSATATPLPISPQPAQAVQSVRPAWQDLRKKNHQKVIGTATKQLGDSLAIFSEQTNNDKLIITYDRLSVPQKKHLLIAHFPPSIEVWQQIITASGAQKIYLLGEQEFDQVSAPIFIKRLLGLIRYVVNKKAGNVEAKRMATALATTDVACALGLALLRKVDLVDWYADEGVVYVELLDNPMQQEIKQLTEYHQLEGILQQIDSFRRWCSTASLTELDHAINSSTTNNTVKLDQSFEMSDAPISVISEALTNAVISGNAFVQ